MTSKQIQDGGRSPFKKKSLYRHMSAKKSSDFDEICYRAADFEPNDSHMTKNKIFLNSR